VATGTEGIVEGTTRLFPPATNLANPVGSPGAKAKGVPFYNPGMALNRDLSLLIVAAEAARKGRELDVADVLAGTGARCLRLAHEVAAPLIVHANDADPTALAAIRRGAAANGVPVARLRPVHGDAHAFLASRRFDVVDVDPYGSPMPFLDAAVRATRHDGLLCVTATDTGALAGTYPRVCRRRYDAHHGLHAAPWRAEVGLRVLAGAVVRAAARFDRVAVPVLSLQNGHWMRVVARVEDGRKDADAALRRLADAVLEPETGSGRFLAPGEARPKSAWAGPLWSGPLHDAEMAQALLAARAAQQVARAREVDALLPLLIQESAAPAFWVVPDRLQASLGPPPRRDRLLVRLAAAGHAASRSHLDPQGVRTDATLAALKAAWHADAA
jgi:tRNA (guanine26-N2/guanine27-N2)-dimethyltransferase